MKTRKWSALFVAAMTALCMGSCSDDWGKMDPRAGNQVFPKLEKLNTFNFDDELDPTVIQTFAYDGGEVAGIGVDEEYGTVLHMNGGYARVANPATAVKIQKAVGLTFWMKQPAEDLEGALFSFQNEDGTSKLSFSADGQLNFTSPAGSYDANGMSDILPAGAWHFVGVSIGNEEYVVTVDGEEKIREAYSPAARAEEGEATIGDAILEFAATAPYLYLGYGNATQTQELKLDDITAYRNEITTKEVKVPNKTVGPATLEKFDPIYFNSFDNTAGLKIKGGGSFANVGGKFGNVFKNVSGGMRANYLVLPSDVLSKSTETQELSISVWVNKGEETDAGAYQWCPLFMAYASDTDGGENGAPMLACQYRGVLQVNCNGWSDFTDDINVNGANKLWNNASDWLADGGWHLYTATFTAEGAKVYLDGKLANEWAVSGEGNNNVIAGLFSNGADLKHICLGGNQAWNWGDPDPGFWFDDIAIYNRAISPEQIKDIMAAKGTVYFNSFEFGAADATVVGEGTFIDSDDDAHGMVFSNVGGAQRSNYLLLPGDVFTHAKETQATSIAVWVNRGNESVSSAYMWSPLLTAYGAAPSGNTNTFPMLACQYRGVLQINCGGWCDFTDDINAAGANKLYHDGTDWLSDGKWHLYTAVFTPKNAKVYFDGELKNEWNVSGEGDNNVIAGLFNAGDQLNYVCLGGNQAWNWGDNDPGFWFDDMAIYNIELSQADIQAILDSKK